MSEENLNVVNKEGNKKFTKIITILVVIAVVLSIFFYVRYQMSLNNPSAQNKEKIEALVLKVEKLIDLPQGETPTLAEITNTENLKSQPFFAKAKVGDQVLLYTVARKAYLYDPKAHIVVEVASVNLGN